MESYYYYHKKPTQIDTINIIVKDNKYFNNVMNIFLYDKRMAKNHVANVNS